MQFEYLSHFNAACSFHRRSAARTGIGFFNQSDVGNDIRFKITPGIYIDKMLIRFVGAAYGVNQVHNACIGNNLYAVHADRNGGH